jgi:hypothetical protein
VGGKDVSPVRSARSTLDGTLPRCEINEHFHSIQAGLPDLEQAWSDIRFEATQTVLHDVIPTEADFRHEWRRRCMRSRTACRRWPRGATSYRKIHAFINTQWVQLNEVFGSTWQLAPTYTAVRKSMRSCLDLLMDTF